jgi:predicted phage terminase large subunit-like protein
LWPERYGYSFIAERKKYPSSFNALYQGRPTSQEGNILKRDWWQYYDVLPTMQKRILSVDATFKDEDDSDYVAIQVWGKTKADIYLIDNVKARLNFPATLQAIRNILKKHPGIAGKYVEDKANGPAIISMLNSEIGGFIKVNPQGGKVARVNAVSPYIESGNVFLPRQAEWVHDFVEEAASFPNGKHDDQVDAMSQALNRFIYHNADIPLEHDPDNLTPSSEKQAKAIKQITGGKPKLSAYTKGMVNMDFLYGLLTAVVFFIALLSFYYIGYKQGSKRTQSLLIPTMKNIVEQKKCGRAS